MTFQDLVKLKFNSALLRRILGGFYKEGDICRVPFGPLRGARLRYSSTVNYHAILGLWDVDIFKFLETALWRTGLLRKDSIAADVGANIGFYSLWLSKRLAEVYAFEPAPEPRGLLLHNLGLNNARNVHVVEQACSSQTGQTEFFLAAHHHASSLHSSWAGGHGGAPVPLRVEATTLDHYFLDKLERGPNFIKLDIEGGGTFALPGAARCFRQARPFVLVESHTPAEDGAISSVLTGFDYSAYRLNDWKWVADPASTHPNPEGVWGTMLLCPRELQARIAA